MASRTVSAKEDSPDSSETPSSATSLETRSLGQPEESSFIHHESHTNIPEQTNIWSPLDNFKTSFLNQLGYRFLQLLEKGTLKLDPNAIIWIDDNGLPTTEGLPTLGPEDMKRPRPFYFAGQDADLTAYDDGISLERTSWRQPAMEEKTPTPTSLFDLVFTELKSKPQITHLAWKNLLRRFELPAASREPWTDLMTANRVKEAIIQEKKDFRNFERLQNAFTNAECMRGMLLWISYDAIHSLAGVDPKSSDRDAALECLDSELGGNVSEVMRLADMLQLGQVPSDRFVTGAEKLAKVASVLRAGEMGPSMGEHLAARGHFLDNGHEPRPFRGRKRRRLE
ncbi:hypothetical protein TrVFT333_007528 [Trichoderma virens FT-333]|nr:hypothetical protein TrVFT333_007528 [Trichoderma virens FT-333]